LASYIKEEHSLRKLKNVLLNEICETKKKEVTTDWRQLLNEKLHDFYPSSNIIRVMKSRRMRLTEYVTSMREKRGVKTGLWGNWKESEYFKGLDVDWRQC
jgi:nitrogenase subunit NifH